MKYFSDVMFFLIFCTKHRLS